MNNVYTVPTLYLSSEQVGWQGLIVRAFHEPGELEGWIEPVSADIALVQVTRGAMYMEQRHKNGTCKSLTVQQGDLFLNPGGGTAPELYWRSLSPEPLQTLHLHLSRELFSQTVTELSSGKLKNLELRGRSGFRDPLLSQLGLTLRQELEQPALAGALYAQSAAQLLAVHLLRHYTSLKETLHEPASQSLSPQQLKQLTEFVQANLSTDLSLDVLAQQVGFSVYYFSRLFRQATGESPHQFVLRQRIECARHLLKERKLPLAEIALLSGFASQSHLTSAFKRQLGLTPYTYRQQQTT